MTDTGKVLAAAATITLNLPGAIRPATADHEEGPQAANEKCPPQVVGC